MLDTAAIIGIGGVAVGLLLIAGHFDLSIGVVAVASALGTALLTGPAGWGIWPALLASLGGALLIGLVNGLLVVNTGLPSFLVTLATFLVLQGIARAGGHGRQRGLPGDRPGRGRRLVVGRGGLRLHAARSATAASGSRCSGSSWSPRWRPGRCGGPASATASSPAAARAGRPASSACRWPGRRSPCSASPRRRAG